MSHIGHSDNPFMGSVTHPERAAATVAMARLVFGAELVERNCVTLSLINADSPMVFDATMLGALKVYARANQATIVTPFILSGAMAPRSVVGTLTQTLGAGGHCLHAARAARRAGALRAGPARAPARAPVPE